MAVGTLLNPQPGWGMSNKVVSTLFVGQHLVICLLTSVEEAWSGSTADLSSASEAKNPPSWSSEEIWLPPQLPSSKTNSLPKLLCPNPVSSPVFLQLQTVLRLSHIRLAGRRWSCLCDSYPVSAWTIWESKTPLCGYPDAIEIMCSGLCRLRMAAVPSCLQWGGRMPGPCLRGARPPPVACQLAGLRKGGVCFVFVFYRLVFLALEIGSGENIPPRSLLTL